MSRAKEYDREIRDAIVNVRDEATQIDIIMKKRRYFGPEENSEFYPIVQDYLSNNLDVKQVTKKLLTPINNAILQNRKNLNLLDLWYSIIHSAKRLPFRDTTGLNKFVSLMKTIKSSSPSPTVANPNIYTCLHGFGMAARETMNDSPGYGAGYLLPEVRAYANMLFFYALLTHEKVVGFWTYCICEMSVALETLHKDDRPEGVHHPGTATEKHNATIPSAAVWIFAMGSEIYEREQDLTPKSKYEGNPGGGGPLWQGKAEFSKERWALWKKRFQELAEMEGLTEEVKGVAREAADAMNGIDDGAT